MPRSVAREADRLVGWLSVAAGQLQAVTGGQVVAGAGGSRLRTAGLLRGLRRVARAVLDGVLSQEQAAVLARLVGRVPAEQLAEVEPQLVEPLLTALEALARRQGDTDARTAGQRRADALVELAERSLRHDADLGVHGGFRPQVSHVLPADWAARQAGRTTCAVAAWTGPATRGRVEAVLCDARISRVLLDPAGQVSGLQPLPDTISKSQRRALAARDLGRAARGCTRPPAMCDAHHLLHRADGGSNALANLVLLCRRHHVLWHLGTTTLADLHPPWVTGQQTGADPPAA